jgi:hypothetical protein
MPLGSVRPRLRQDRGHLQQVLHPKGGPDLDERVRRLVAEVRELVDGPGRHGDRLAGAGDDRPQPGEEFHPATHHGEALLLDRVDVRARHVAVGPQEQVERQQLAGGVGSRLAEPDPLAADGVRDELSTVSH